ncbi:MFS transporter [Achromobacter sp. GG226]|uniref:MFS transporter n=1 Tax=Verticiella alkaliphila TaxID=2779529 RepID=UPI001C0DABA0|nr:MFS transporter [Verticiella sp. GG226]MBU4610394.1 MFS transporter [Verticiella sp. GG226]
MTSPVPDPHRRLRRFIACGLTTAVVGSSTPIPLYPIYRAELGLDALTMTMIFVVYVAAVLCALLVAPAILARLRNPYRLLVPGLGIVTLGALTLAQADSLAGLLAGRIIAGIGTGCVTSSVNMAMVDLSPGRDVRHAAMVSTLSFGAGSALGPALSGGILQLGIWPLVTPFVLVSIAALVTAVPAARRWHDTATATAPVAGQPATPRPARDPIPWAAFGLCSALIILSWGLGSILMALGPFFGDRLLGVSDYALTGYAVALFTLTGTTSQWLHRRAHLRRGLVRGAIIVAVGLSLAFTGLLLGSVPWVAGALVLTSFGQGGAFACGAALLQQVAPPSQRVRMVSWFYMAGYVGNLLPLLLGAITDRFGAMSATLGFLVVCVAAMIGIATGARRVFRQPAGAAHATGA